MTSNGSGPATTVVERIKRDFKIGWPWTLARKLTENASDGVLNVTCTCELVASRSVAMAISGATLFGTSNSIRKRGRAFCAGHAKNAQPPRFHKRRGRGHRRKSRGNLPGNDIGLKAMILTRRDGRWLIEREYFTPTP